MIDNISVVISLTALLVAVSINAFNYSRESKYLKDKYRKQGADEALKKLGIK